MIKKQWTDLEGRKHACLLQDDMLQDVSEGIPLEPPDLDRLDWQAIKVDLHNQLFDRGLIDWRAAQQAQEGLRAAIMAALHRRLQDLYREHLQR